MKRQTKQVVVSGHAAGFALLVTLIVLVVLATLTAGMATRLTMAKRRQNYMIEYQRAHYGVDSGIKYMLTEFYKQRFSYEERADKPDFSDLFWMDEQEYAEMVNTWAADATQEQIEGVLKEGASLYESEPVDAASLMSQLAALFGGQETPPEVTAVDEDMDYYVINLDPNDVEIPGPYGPPWPYVIDPINIEIGPCDITITIEDENAKMPLSWLVTAYKADDKRAQYALETFGEWMQMTADEIKELQAQCEKISEKKLFKLNPGPILISKAAPSRRGSAAKRFRASKTKKSQAPSQQRPAIAHTTDFAKLFHSSLLDSEQLARPVPGTGRRSETALKYLGLWGSQRVNVNTAPRHVLESVFMFATEPVELAHQVILQRQEKPFVNVSEIKELGRLDTETFDQLKNYITTTSTFFKITIISRSGNASASAIVTVIKEARKTQTLMVLYE
ncbi:MAG: general secretion pathway protein GspK [Planctomycetes bacterium]|nr:general secretion pathway protein GspK [Planctomycetota bacterium]